MMKTQCPKCGQKYEVDELFLGQQVECEACKQPFTITTNAPVPVPAVPQSSQKPKNNSRLKLTIYVIIILIPFFMLGKYLYSEFVWQGPRPTHFAGYELGGLLTNPSVLQGNFYGSIYYAKLLEKDLLYADFDTCCLELSEAADGVRIKEIKCIKKRSSQYEFDEAVRSMKYKFGRPNGLNTDSIVSWRWDGAEFQIQFSDNRLSVKLTK